MKRPLIYRFTVAFGLITLISFNFCGDEACAPVGAYDRVFTSISSGSKLVAVYSFSFCHEEESEPVKGTSVAIQTETGWKITNFNEFEDPCGIGFQGEIPYTAYLESRGDQTDLFAIPLTGDIEEFLIDTCSIIYGIDLTTSKDLYPALSYFCIENDGIPEIRLSKLEENGSSTSSIQGIPCSEEGVSSLYFFDDGEPFISFACKDEEGAFRLYYTRRSDSYWSEFEEVAKNITELKGKSIFNFTKDGETPVVFFVADDGSSLMKGERNDEEWKVSFIADMGIPLSFSVSMDETREFHITWWEDYINTTGILYGLLYKEDDEFNFSLIYDVKGIGNEISITSKSPTTPHIFCNWKDGKGGFRLDYLTLNLGEWEDTIIY